MIDSPSFIRGNEGPVGKKRNEALCLVVKPFLIPEEEVDDHHGRAYEVVVKVSLEELRFL